MTVQEKVSIIVPIYKVEKYIHRCINSIINQTYANLEIILVDDGSPDSCGEIADQYQEKDPRIQVIHKQNGGLSDARNAGMGQVSGAFTMFVDSDDWLEKDMVETMVNNSLAYQADIVQAAFYYAYEDRLLADYRHFRENDLPVLLNNKQLMYELVINEKVKNFAWGKLYRTKLIEDIPFEKGVLFEDVFWAHQVMHRADRFLILHQPFYYYCQRDDSIVASYTPRNLDMIKGLKERHHFIEVHYKGLTDVSYKHLFKTSLIHYNLLVMNRKKDKFGAHRGEISAFIMNNYSRIREAVQDDKQLSRQLSLFFLHPYLNIAYLGFRKGLRSMKVLPKPVGLEQVEL
jgi:glycosyltransferase involved in cell wall biosynthesis